MTEPKSMREVHEIMERLHEKRKSMSREEVIKDIRDGAKKVVEEYGLKIEKVVPKDLLSYRARHER